MSPIEQKRAERDKLRADNRAAFEAAAKEAAANRLDAEIAHEKALAEARQMHGHDRVIAVEIAGATPHGPGFAIFRWPDQITARHFANRGILKADRLTDELCEDFAVRCCVSPDIGALREMLKRNPGASVAIAGKIQAAMRTEAQEEGKE